jgi:23S rRNA (adenine2503-C2)-methyltransferase
MKMKVVQVPTGKIIIGEFEGRKFECLSLGDYGKDKNIKADFLGNTKEINGVPSGEVMPLSEKWVITISSQFGCSMGCRFCDVPKVGKGVNISRDGLRRQVTKALAVYDVYKTKRLNVHYARMGEPTFNWDVIEHAYGLPEQVKRSGLETNTVHPVVSTMMPKNHKHLERYLYSWCKNIKNDTYKGEAGLQLSINSTNDEHRFFEFNESSLPLRKISEICARLPDPVGRKYTLNFAFSDHSEIDSAVLKEMFDPNKFMVKITPIHVTDSAIKNNIITTDGYEFYAPYREIENNLKGSGFDVLVFIPSKDEDEGMITCGNAILSGKSPKNTIHTEN